MNGGSDGGSNYYAARSTWRAVVKFSGTLSCHFTSPKSSSSLKASCT